MCGSLEAVPRKQHTDLDDILEDGGYLSKARFEPLDRIKHFDFWRLYYTAFSRAQNLLVLAAQERHGKGLGKSPSKYFEDVFHALPEWRTVDLTRFTFEKVKEINLKREYSFTSHITLFENCAEQYRFFKELEFAAKFLDFNNPDKNPKAFLRQPQYEALEIYVFLKEFMDNAKVEEIFKAWFEKTGPFAGRQEGGIVGDTRQGSMFDAVTQDQYKAVFAAMRKNSRIYPNYIFALTMGTGKTILMATCIFYEFLLGNKFEKDKRYCHNALVFAPDKTVLQSLKEIESFDLALVVPPEYVNFLTTHLRFHYLEEAGTSLSTLDRSRFNIVVSNTQKIILKRRHKEKTPLDALFGATPDTVTTPGVYGDAADLYAWDQPEEEAELTTNQRFEKLCRLEQLGIYVDEAHHAFGKTLAKDMGIGAKESSFWLRPSALRAFEIAWPKVTPSEDMAGSSLALPVNPLVRGYANCYALSTRGSTAKRTNPCGSGCHDKGGMNA